MKLSKLIKALKEIESRHGDIETLICVSGGRQSRKASDEGEYPTILFASDLAFDVSGPGEARELLIDGVDHNADPLPDEFDEHQREDESDADYDARTRK